MRENLAEAGKYTSFPHLHLLGNFAGILRRALDVITGYGLGFDSFNLHLK